MSKETIVTKDTRIGILGWMFLIFMTLKLTGHITWSWWLITAPLWGPILVALLIVFFIFILTLVFD
ncbi:MAG: hypothetical protein CMF22_10540 [Idiomarinaceae bacterium]|nr:hypothetical protein [Idiomarinaceae bacterium]MBG23878.1 hypothetical protein [Idiomarinaceae bacterium]|tara:strand:- start:4721 stop:4918 length:198 start_codon:yes stop_codon:yes gene_type:complete